MKNICMITQSAYPQDPRVRREAEAIAEKGFQVDIICLQIYDQPEVESFGNITAYRIVRRESKESLFDYLTLSTKFFIKGLLKTYKILKTKKYCLAQAHNMPDYIVFALIFFKLKKIPVILDVHDLTYELFNSKWPEKGKFILPIIKTIEKLSYNFADYLITVTNGCKEKILNKNIPESKVSVVLNTANQNIFKFDESRKFSPIKFGLKLIYHGTVAERFGLHTVIEALRIIKNEAPGLQFFIYGKYDNSYLETLKKKVTDYDLIENVFFNEQIPQEQVYQKIKLCDIAVVPYVANDYMNLALSTKSFEYAASGIPIISTELNSMKEIFNDKEIQYYESEDHNVLASKIIELCENPERRIEMVNSAFDSLKEISGLKMAEKYCAIIETLTKLKIQPNQLNEVV